MRCKYESFICYLQAYTTVFSVKFEIYTSMSKNKRFSQVLSEHGVSRSEYARRIGVTVSAVGSWCREGKPLGFDPIERLLIEFPDVDARWLITGIESNHLVVSNNSNQSTEVKENYSPLVDYLRDDISRLNEEVRKLTSENGALKREIELIKGKQ